ncbi:MAG: glutamine--fructose-6-phosphate transaminase (isomerizing) [Myxococcales bacterium]|nr:glutamine--fructose-6-phosphate transaminase (isomerizing) [Myxococcales bacterium]USN50125.1 MAG: glutamine--fructose-6-phosphate transaminase (isomerizing) [Myxococcales bacterium]
MCGIVGYIGEQNAKTIIIKGLERLEYRGYDSSGIAINENNSFVTLKKTVGKLGALKNHIENLNLNGHQAIGHTRWATHGAPSDVNAHPHKYGRVSVVHNGIIENFSELKHRLQTKGHNFSSSTDTEVVAHILNSLLDEGIEMLSALQRISDILRGTYSLGILLDGDNERLYFIKNGSPLIVARGDNESFFASDQMALVDFKPDYYPLKDGDYGFISKTTVEIYDLLGKRKDCHFLPLKAQAENIERMGHKHFMHKEIFEQPEVIERVLLGRIKNGLIDLDNFGLKFEGMKHISRIHIIACGSSYIAGLIAKPALETALGIPVEVEIASEYRYRTTLSNSSTLVIAISQSGETADTLAALDKALSEGALCVSVCNVLGSAIPRVCENSGGNLYLNAGPEISVASTKAFLAQVVALKLLTLALEKYFTPQSPHEESQKVQAFFQLKNAIMHMLEQDEAISKIAFALMHQPRMLFLGRGELLPVALEGALKMKELSYIFAEGYAAGELKHGPIATIDPQMPVVIAFSNDILGVKTLSNLFEVKARGACVISVAPKNAVDVQEASDYFIPLEHCDEFLLPILATVPLQLLAYHLSNHKGIDVDKPRNLAKSVTVE